jgi:S1-C subfamily serine protease
MLRTLLSLVFFLAVAVAADPSRAADLDALQAVVGIAATIPKDARSAETLGTERAGSGVVIDDQGLVLTIGYLVNEAEEITLAAFDGKPTSARLIAYDTESGLALVRANAKLPVKPIRLGDSTKLAEGGDVMVMSMGGERPLVSARVVSVRPFAGYWEYMLERAIFTAPPHTAHSGAALIGDDGRLYGVGSLFVSDARAPRIHSPGNMFVPINELKPVLADLLDKGKRTTPPRPWIGINSQDVSGRIVVTRVTPGGPAAAAGLADGDLILGVAGKPVSGLVELYRAMWNGGPAGTSVKLNVLPSKASDFRVRETTVKSVDRAEWQKKAGRTY